MENSFMTFKKGDKVLVGRKQPRNTFLTEYEGTILSGPTKTSTGKEYYNVLTKSGVVVPGFADRMQIDEVKNSKLWKILS